MEFKNGDPLQDEKLTAVVGGYTPESGDFQANFPCKFCGVMPIWVHYCGYDPQSPWHYAYYCDACNKSWNEPVYPPIYE